VTDSGLVITGVLKVLTNFFTGCLHNGQCASAGLDMGRLKSKPLLQEGHPFSGSSAM